MIKSILLFSGVLVLSIVMNTNTINRVDSTDPDEKVISAEVEKEIDAMNEIIVLKLHKAEKLEKEAALLLQQEHTRAQGSELLEEARLERLMTLKYKAAIACRLR